MNSRLLPSYVKHNILSSSKKLSTLQGIRDFTETFASIVLLFFMTIFFVLINQIHKDYKKLEDKPN